MRIFLVIFWGVVFAAVLGYGFLIFKAPEKYRQQMCHLYGINSDSHFSTATRTNDSLLIISRKNLFCKAQLQLSTNDSIGLVVDLNDSTVSLFLKGIELHKAKIKSYTLPAFFASIEDSLQQAMFSKPVSIVHQKGNIPKKPLRVKKAPKNEQEANLQTQEIDSIPNTPIFVTFDASPYFEVEMSSVHSGEKLFEKKYREITAEKKISEISSHMKSVIKGKTPPYIPKVIIYLDNGDIAGIYRALPSKPSLAFNW